MPGADRDGGDQGRAVAESADELGLGWRAAMRAVAGEANVPDRFRPVVWLGVDERSPAAGAVRDPPGRSGHGDGDRYRRGRSAVVVLQALAAQGEEWLAGMELVALDPFTRHSKAIRHLLLHGCWSSISSTCSGCSCASPTRLAGATSA